MPVKQSCKNCEKEFVGRRNKVFCTLKCKNDHHNQKESEIKKTANQDLLSMERNTRILNKLLEARPYPKGEIYFGDLRHEGFDFSGPFRFKKGSEQSPVLIVGDYELNYRLTCYEYKKWKTPVFKPTFSTPSKLRL